MLVAAPAMSLVRVGLLLLWCVAVMHTTGVTVATPIVGKQYLIQNPNPYFRLEHPTSGGDCIFQKSVEGEYTFISSGNDAVCALYVVADPEYVVEFEILRFDVSCTKGGLLTVFDGWENNGEYFPSQEDHPKPMDQRFAEFCGPIKPWKPFVTSQNVGIVLFRVPTRGNYFSVLVSFRKNPKPCNVMLLPLSESPIYTLRNYGRRGNCSAAFIYPMNFRILATSIGSQSFSGSGNVEFETGLITKCRKRGVRDYAEFMGGTGLSIDGMTVIQDVCGLDSLPSKKAIGIPCGTTAVRLVSTGRFEDSITFGYEPIIERERVRLCAKALMTV
ncbi:corticotropin-releasing factor-binding protein [Dermacentor variabilis]|uniref:corticotropin-releasing factor-binding protein n=1 Tax=Dermacentor variabilis TaxID=34621 RepID=UPI003F5B6DFA